MKKIQLFCLPYAGTSASFYYSWKKNLDDRIELIPIELTGRGSRMTEPFYQDFDEAIEDVYQQITEKIENEYILFGHCMGSILCYEVAVMLNHNMFGYPDHVILSGQATPDNREGLKLLYEEKDDIVFKEIMNIGGSNISDILDEDIAEFFLPILRADCRIFDNYVLSHDEKIQCDISIFYGENDTKNNYEAMKRWEHYTNKSCLLYPFRENHFFISSLEDKVINTINHIVKQQINSSI